MKTSTMSLRASLLILFCVVAGRVHGHGLMTDPPQRSSLWRYFPGQGFEENYNDNELFCGGLSVSFFSSRVKLLFKSSACLLQRCTIIKHVFRFIITLFRGVFDLQFDKDKRTKKYQGSL